MSFPTFRYHREHGAKIVKSAAELEALDKNWADNPGKVGLIPREVAGGMAYDKDPNFKEPKEEKAPPANPSPAAPAGKPEKAKG